MKRKQRAAIFIVLALLVSLVIQFYQPVPVMAAGTISKVEITGVTPPEAGKKPTLDGIKTDTPGVKIDPALTLWKVWQQGGLDPMDPNDPFEAGEEYCIEIHVVPEAGYAFAGTTTASVNGENATKVVEELGENFRKILLEFPEVEPKRYVSHVDIFGITLPKAGEKPTLEGIYTDSEGFVVFPGGSSWKEMKGLKLETMDLDDPGTLFEAEKNYWLEIIVGPDAISGFSDTFPFTALVNGKQPTDIKSVEGENLKRVILKFSLPPAGDLPEAISHVDITGVISPAIGEPAIPQGIRVDTDGVVLGNDHTKWYEFNDGTHTPMPAGASFEAGKQYSIMIEVKPLAGYTLEPEDKLTATVNGENATGVRYSTPETRDIVCVFPPLPKVVSNVDIHGVIPPQIGKSPTTTDVRTYTKGVYIDSSAWLKVEEGKPPHEVASNEIFEKGAEYWFATNVFCNAGYKFPDRTADINATVNGSQTKDIKPAYSGMKTGIFITRKFSPLTDAENKMTKEPEPMVDGSVDSASFTSGANVDDFQYVMFGDEELHPNYYEVKGDSGSTNVTINYDFVKALDPGSYVVKIVSKTGIAKGEIVILKEAPPKVDETPKDPPKVDEAPQEPPKVDETPKDPPKVDEAPQEPPKVDETPKDPPKVDEEAKPAADAEQTAKPAPRLPATGESLGTALWIALPLLAAGALLLIYRKKITSN
ncbi:MAG: LPXTG cell wall anchor domain-containing protein [Saccharofermentanales bacterium]|jgi:LPXTG-motif cell wall-anchored protein